MRGQTNKSILNGKLQRTLRSSLTDAERCLWRHLCRRQMLGLKFRRQHPYGDYILDFVCLEAKLIVELDGSQHFVQAEHDAHRTRFLEHALSSIAVLEQSGSA